ncbi:MAG: hypothetical protein ABS98_13875 [Lysobacteraceae bacterium SCN 69-48]|nr:MAG: hypothetical protein ABS98_13875 [Xanthomonadaceae bacterium SCN 69-48]
MSDKQSIKETMAHLNDPTIVEQDEAFRMKKHQDADKGDEKAQWWVKFDEQALEKAGEVYQLDRNLRERNDGTWMRDLEANFKNSQDERDAFRRTDRPHSGLKDKATAWDEQADRLENDVLDKQKAIIEGGREAGPEGNQAVREQLDLRMKEEKDLVEKRQQYDLLPSEQLMMKNRQEQAQAQAQSNLEEPSQGFREAGYAPGEERDGREGYQAVKDWQERRREQKESHNSTTKHGMEGYAETALAEREFEKRLEATQKEFMYQNNRRPTDAEVGEQWAKEDAEKGRVARQSGQQNGSPKQDEKQDGQKQDGAQHKDKEASQAQGQSRIHNAMGAAAGIENLGPMAPQERKEAQNGSLAERRAQRTQNHQQNQDQKQTQKQVQKRSEGQSQ